MHSGHAKDRALEELARRDLQRAEAEARRAYARDQAASAAHTAAEALGAGEGGSPWAWDAAAGYYVSEEGYYYDAASRQFYDPADGKWSTNNPLKPAQAKAAPVVALPRAAAMASVAGTKAGGGTRTAGSAALLKPKAAIAKPKPAVAKPSAAAKAKAAAAAHAKAIANPKEAAALAAREAARARVAQRKTAGMSQALLNARKRVG